jgi:hypothetical protein
MFEPQEDVVIVLRRPGGEAYAMLAPDHEDYYDTLATAMRIPRVPDGMYVVSAEIDPESLTFSLYRSSAEASTSPLGELPRVLQEYGWAEHQAIVVMPVYTDLPEQDDWARVADAYAEIARATGVTVYFPDVNSKAGWHYGNLEPAVGPTDVADVPEGRCRRRMTRSPMTCGGSPMCCAGARSSSPRTG